MANKTLALIIAILIAGCVTQKSMEEQNADFEKQRQEKVAKLNQKI